jgi:hypothetical protein
MGTAEETINCQYLTFVLEEACREPASFARRGNLPRGAFAPKVNPSSQSAVRSGLRSDVDERSTDCQECVAFQRFGFAQVDQICCGHQGLTLTLKMVATIEPSLSSSRGLASWFSLRPSQRHASYKETVLLWLG